MNILIKLLILNLCIWISLTNINALLFINLSGYKLSVDNYRRELLIVNDCTEVNESILDLENIIVHIEKMNIFFTFVTLNKDVIPGDTIIIFKEGNGKIYSAKKLGIAAKCVNKSLILEKIQELEDSKQLPIPQPIPVKNKCCACCKSCESCNIV